jgi:hypothetical protein
MRVYVASKSKHWPFWQALQAAGIGGEGLSDPAIRAYARNPINNKVEGQHEQVPAYSTGIRAAFVACIRARRMVKR